MKKDFYISEEEKIALVSYLSGEITPGESEVLHRWLKKDKSHALVFDQMSDIWTASLLRTGPGHSDSGKAWEELEKALHLKKRNMLGSGWKDILRIAAVFVFALFLGGFGYYLFTSKTANTSKDQPYTEYMAPLGSRSFVQLSDGSRIWLNSGSTLKYDQFYGHKNRVLLLAGEAFFEVEKNEDLPFVVKTGEIDVIALGTKFNIKAYPEEKTIETMLIEGSVKLESQTVKLSDNIVLKPNEKAIFTRKNLSVERITPDGNIQDRETPDKPRLEIIRSVEPEPVVSWKDKRWVIKNEKLGDLAVKLERRYNVNFIFDNDLLKEYAFGGTLEDETLDQVMEAIRFSSPIRYMIDNQTVYVMSDGQKMEKFKNILKE